MAYDGFGNMTSLKVGTRTLATYKYADRNGLLETLTDGNGNTTYYTKKASLGVGLFGAGFCL